MRAHENAYLATIWTMLRCGARLLTPSMYTRTVFGVHESFQEASPSSPPPLEPQHLAVESESTAQVCVLPALMRIAPASPDTGTGWGRGVFVPSPSWPRPFAPQHFA